MDTSADVLRVLEALPLAHLGYVSETFQLTPLELSDMVTLGCVPERIAIVELLAFMVRLQQLGTLEQRLLSLPVSLRLPLYQLMGWEDSTTEGHLMGHLLKHVSPTILATVDKVVNGVSQGTQSPIS